MNGRFIAYFATVVIGLTGSTLAQDPPPAGPVTRAEKITPAGEVTPAEPPPVIPAEQVVPEDQFPLVDPTQPPVAPALKADPEKDRFDFANHFFSLAEKSEDKLIKFQNYQKSAQLFSALLFDFPLGKHQAEIRYQLGTSLLHINKPEEAAVQYRSIIQRFPKTNLSALSAFHLAIFKWKERDFVAAAPYFSITAQNATEGKLRQRSLFFQANCYLRQQQSKLALPVLEALVKDPDQTHPYRSRSLLLIGSIHQEAQRYSKAVASYAPLLNESIPVNERGNATFNSGLCFIKLQKKAEATKLLESVLANLEFQKWHSDAQASLMSLAYADKNYKRVLKLYKALEITQKNKTGATLHLIAGKAASKLEKYYDAIKMFALSERALPQSNIAFDAAYRRLLCFFNIEGSNIPQQVDAFLEIYEGTHPENTYIQSARLMKAETFFSLKKYTEAAAVYNKIDTKLIDKQNLAGLFYHKGWCLAESGDPNGGIQALTSFLKQYPKDPRVPQSLAKRGQCYLSIDNHVQALQDFDQLIQAYPKTQLASVALQKSAEVQRKQGEVEDMIARYETLIGDFPKLPSATKANAYFRIGRAHFQKKRYPKSAKALEAARKIDPKNFNDIAGSQIVLCYYMMQDVEKLLKSVQRVEKDVPTKFVLQRITTWLGIKSFERRDYHNASRYLTRSLNRETPAKTKVFIWKRYAKASLEISDYDNALFAAEHILKVETHAVSLADAFLDKSKALFGLKRYADAVAAAEAGRKKQSRGLLNAELTLLLGDIAFAQKDFVTALQHYGTTAEFISDNRLKPIAIYKSMVTAQKKGDAELSQSYKDILTKDFPGFKGVEGWNSAR